MDYAVVNKVWSPKSHLKAMVFLTSVNELEFIIRCYTNKSASNGISIRQHCYTSLLFFFFFFLRLLKTFKPVDNWV